MKIAIVLSIMLSSLCFAQSVEENKINQIARDYKKAHGVNLSCTKVKRSIDIKIFEITHYSIKYLCAEEINAATKTWNEFSVKLKMKQVKYYDKNFTARFKTTVKKAVLGKPVHYFFF